MLRRLPKRSPIFTDCINWIDDLCDAVLDVAETRFYRGVAKVTRGFVHMETEVVADELEVLQGLADKQAA